jgi:hypothetical protein
MAGAVSTYMQAGGQYGFHLLWLLLVVRERSLFKSVEILSAGRNHCGRSISSCFKSIKRSDANRSARR